VLRLRMQELLDDAALNHAEREVEFAELAHAQRELESSRERYASLFDFAPVGYANLDRHGCIQNINLEGARLLGREREELIDRPLLPLILPVDRRRWLSHLTRLRDGEPRGSVELHVDTRTGAPLVVRLYSVRSKPFSLDAKLDVAFPTALVDVTAQHRAELAVRQSESRFRSLIENAADTVTILDQAGTIQYQSPNVVSVLGYTAVELEGRKAFEFIHPDGVGEARKEFNRILTRPDELRQSVNRVRHQDGSWRWLQITGRNLLADPAVGGVVLNSRDITKEREALLAMQESEARFRTMADGAPVLIWVAGTNKACTWFNKPWLDFTGRRLEQELGGGWAENIHPQDLARCVETYEQAFDARREFKMEYRLRRHDGRWRWVLDHGVPLYGPDHEFRGYVGSCVDITERKQAEGDLRYQLRLVQNITEKAASCIFMTDEQHRITFANPEAERTFGFTAKEMLGAPLHKLLRRRFPGELPLPDGESPILNVQSAPKKPRDRQEVFLRKDGTPVTVACSSALLEVEGERVGAVFMMRDITERLRHEAGLRQANDQLEARVVKRTEQLAQAHLQLQRQMGERAELQEQILAATENERARVAQDLHDGLCQLLLGIRFKLEVLRGRLEKRSLPGVRRLSALARLLDRATEEARGLARGLHPVEAAPEGLMSALKQLAETTRQLFRVKCRCDFPRPVLMADAAAANQLFRIAQEAVTNAIKHGKATSISIRLARDDRQLVLTVANDGSPVKPRAGAAGLGLRTMEYRASQIGAKIELVSKPGEEVELRCTRPWHGKTASATKA